MIRLLGIVLLFLMANLPVVTFSQEIGFVSAPEYTVYIVRHGEKLPGKDPQLSEAGKQRAGDLFRLLKDKEIDIIYSTPYQRTMMTGDSLRVYLNIDTLTYTADATGDGLIDAVKRDRKKRKNILVIAHSNTIGTILRKLGAADKTFKDLDDHEYNHIYILHVKDSKLKLEKKEYGAPNPIVPTGSSMKGN